MRATGDLAAALADAGHEVHIVAEPGDGTATAPAGVPVVEVEGAGRRERAALVHEALLELRARRGLDVVSVPLWDGEARDAAADRRLTTVVSCMTTAHRMTALDPQWARANDGPGAIAAEAEVMRRARHLHGLTEAALREARAHHPAAPVTERVVPRGLRDRIGDPRVPYGPPAWPGAVELLFVGRLEPRKGVDVLLAAAAALMAEGRDISLTLAGPDHSPASAHGNYEATWRARASPEAAARVRFAGAVPDAELCTLLDRADVVCQPSRYESHGIVLVEAMMWGKPVLSSRAGGIPEVLEADRNALLASPGDVASTTAALRTLVSRPDLRGAFGRRSRERYEHVYAIERVGPAMEALFAAALAADARA